MVTSYSNVQPNRVEIYPQIDGTSVVYLHDNIREEDVPLMEEESNEPRTQWVCDEVNFQGVYTREYVEENFDELWVMAETSEMSTKDRLSTLEETVSDLITVIASY